MEIFLTLLTLTLLAAVTSAVVHAIRHDGHGHLPPVTSGRPWHGNALWDVTDPRDASYYERYLPRLR